MLMNINKKNQGGITSNLNDKDNIQELINAAMEMKDAKDKLEDGEENSKMMFGLNQSWVIGIFIAMTVFSIFVFN
jgi:hypothetical protein